jgi:hypothetical protein
MSQQITWNFRVIQKNPFKVFRFSANFHFWAKFHNEVQEICTEFLLLWKVQLITFPKCHYSSKSIHGDRRYLQFCVGKRVRLAEIRLFFFYSTSFSANLMRFLTQNWRYLRSKWMDFDKWWHFGNVMSCTFHNKRIQHKFFGISLQNLAPKFLLKSAKN